MKSRLYEDLALPLVTGRDGYLNPLLFYLSFWKLK
jgi:hypothetical protein